MDSPILEGLKIPTTINKNPIIDESIKINGKEYLFTAVSMGNPHAVIFVKDLENIDISTIGKLIENNSIFPNRTNVEFVEIINRSEVRQRTWESGRMMKNKGDGLEKRKVNVIEDLDGKKTVFIHDILFKGKRSVNWDEVEIYLVLQLFYLLSSLELHLLLFFLLILLQLLFYQHLVHLLNMGCFLFFLIIFV